MVAGTQRATHRENARIAVRTKMQERQNHNQRRNPNPPIYRLPDFAADAQAEL